MIDSCYMCGFWDSDYECCTCPACDMWYCCPMYPELTEEDFTEHGFLIDMEFAVKEEK